MTQKSGLKRAKILLNGGGLSQDAISAIAAATLQASGPAEAPAGEANVGDKMPDGTDYAGLSPATNKPIYAMPADASLTMQFNQAERYAAKLDAHGHMDWRIPTKAELNVLFDNRAAIGGFETTGRGFNDVGYRDAGWYWSASPYDANHQWSQLFGDGYQHDIIEGSRLSVRCVR